MHSKDPFCKVPASLPAIEYQMHVCSNKRGLDNFFSWFLYDLNLFAR